MTVREIYLKFGGDYDGTKARLLDENRMRRFLIKFLESETFENMRKALDIRDYDEAFRMSHTLKGICANLGITRLRDSSSKLTECLRNKEKENIVFLYNVVREDYLRTIDSIKKMQ